MTSQELTEAINWFERMHPPGPGAREMYRRALDALYACQPMYGELMPQDAFQDDKEYIDYLQGVILRLEQSKRARDELIDRLEREAEKDIDN